MTSYKVTLHRGDGEPAVVRREETDSSALALLAAAQYAVSRDLDIVTVEIEIDPL